MGLEGADGLLGNIASVDILGNWLVVTIPLFGYDMTIFNDGFIIENLEVHQWPH